VIDIQYFKANIRDEVKLSINTATDSCSQENTCWREFVDVLISKKSLASRTWRGFGLATFVS